jgi:hypothetical protein
LHPNLTSAICAGTDETVRGASATPLCVWPSAWGLGKVAVTPARVEKTAVALVSQLPVPESGLRRSGPKHW